MPEHVRGNWAGVRMSIEINCQSCQKRYRVKAELAGKKVRCANCGNPVTVPGTSSNGDASSPDDQFMSEIPQAPTPRKPATPKAPPPDEPDIGDPSDRPVFAMPKETEAMKKLRADQAAGKERRCTGCGAAMKVGAVICLNCGYNFATGERGSGPPADWDNNDEPAP